MLSHGPGHPDVEAPLSPGERIASAIVDYIRAADVRYAGRQQAQGSAYQQLVRVINELLADE